MKKSMMSLVLVSTCIFLNQCGSEGSKSAALYGDFGETLNVVIPAGLKVGSATSDTSIFQGALSGTCSESYTGCPVLTASGGADTVTGEILMRLWGLDYDKECTSELFTAGTCFTCTDCSSGSVGTNYIKPTVLADPKSCSSTSTTKGRYVNFGVDPCFFDAMIAQIENIDDCVTVKGEAVDISSAVPWYASWGLPKTINFSGYQQRSDAGGGMWWTVNSGTSANRYFISLDSNWLYGGIKDVAHDQFLFFGSGSPAYYDGRGEGSGINIAGYAGSLSASTKVFEAIQIRDQAPNSYINRMKSNGTHVWFQYWQGSNFPTTPAQAETLKNTPSATRCVEVGASVATSKYVPLSDCVTAFGVASVDALNQDSFYILKVVDGQTAGLINFSKPLTTITAETSCVKPQTESTPGSTTP